MSPNPFPHSLPAPPTFVGRSLWNMRAAEQSAS